MLDDLKASDTERVQKRSNLARTLAENGMSNVLVSTRETVSGFGVKEWALINELDDDDVEELVVPKHCYSAARTLAKHGMVTLEETDEDELIARKRHDGGVVVRIL